MGEILKPHPSTFGKEEKKKGVEGGGRKKAENQ